MELTIGKQTRGSKHRSLASSESGTTPGVYPNKVDVEEVIDTFNITISDDGKYGILQECITWKATVQGLNPCTAYYVRLREIDELLSSGTGNHASKILGRSVADVLDCLTLTRASAVTFTADGCKIRTGQGGSGTSGPTTLPVSGPVQMSSVVVQSAAIATPKCRRGRALI